MIARRSRQGVAAHAGWARPGGGDGRPDVAARALGERPEDRCRGRSASGPRTSPSPPARAVDEVPVVPAELAPGLLDGGLEGRVELFVVVAERGVRDLDPRSDSVVIVGGEPRGGRVGRSGVAVSLARRPRRPAIRPEVWRAPAALGGRRDVRADVLAGEHEGSAEARPLGGPDVGPEVVADHGDVAPPDAGAARRTSAASPPPPRKNSGDGLPTILALTPAANSRPATNAPESIVGPSGVSHQRFLCMPISSAPLRIRRNARLRLSQVEVLGRVADDDRRGAGVGLRRLFVGEEALAFELRPGVVGGQDVERPAGNRRAV